MDPAFDGVRFSEFLSIFKRKGEPKRPRTGHAQHSPVMNFWAPTAGGNQLGLPRLEDVRRLAGRVSSQPIVRHIRRRFLAGVGLGRRGLEELVLRHVLEVMGAVVIRVDPPGAWYATLRIQ